MFGISNKDTGKTISVNDIDKLIGEIDLIDIREPYEYSSGSIKSAKNIPMQILLNNPDKYLKKNKEYYIVCQSGRRSSMLCTELNKKGFDVIDVTGGVSSYLGNNKI